MDVPGVSNPSRHLAERDNLLAEKLNSVIENVNNREQFVPLPVIRTIVAPGEQLTVSNYRIPAGFEARVLNAAVSASPASPDARVDIYYNTTYGNDTGESIVSTSSGTEFTGETSFHQAGEFIIAIRNTGALTLEISASVLLTMRPLGKAGSLLVGSVISGPPGLPGAKGDVGPTGPAGVGTAGPAGMVWRGAWSIVAVYHTNDVVSYVRSSGVLSSFIATQDNTGLNPEDNTTVWNSVAEGGAAGAAGATGATGATGPAGGTPNFGSHIVYGTLSVGMDWQSQALDGYSSPMLSAGQTNNTIPLIETFIQSGTANPGYSRSVNILAGQLRMSFKGNGTFTLPKTAYGAHADYTNVTCALAASMNGTIPYSTLDGSIKGVTVIPTSSDQYVIKSYNGNFETVVVTILGFQPA